MQFFSTSVMSFQQFIIGGVFGFSAVILPQLELPDARIKVDADQQSWIGMYKLVETPLIKKCNFLAFASKNIRVLIQ